MATASLSPVPQLSPDGTLTPTWVRWFESLRNVANFPSFAAISGKPNTLQGYGVGEVDAIPIGTTTPSTGNFTTLQATVIQSQDSISTEVAGYGLMIKEGANAKQGLVVLSAGTAAVANTSIGPNSRVFVTSQIDGGTPGFLRVISIVAGVGFTIKSGSLSDSSTVAYLITDAS